MFHSAQTAAKLKTDFAVHHDSKSHSHVDSWLLITTYLLLGISVLMVFSTTAVSSSQLYGESTMYLRKHLLHVIIGLFGLGVVLRIPPALIKRFSGHLLLFSMFTLILVLIPGIGHSAGGARRWIVAGPVNLQPGEFAKLMIVIYFAAYVDRHKEQLVGFTRGVIIPFLVTGLLAFLLLLEPDFGSTAVIMGVVVCQLLVGGARFSHLASLGAVSIVSVIGLIFTSPYRMRRLTTFTDPFSDPTNSGYQLIQSLIAVGSGGLIGAGLGAGKQKLFYLPAAHTDFIFAVIAEELGLIGAVVVLALFFVFGYRGYKIAQRLSYSPFLSTLAVGLTLLVVFPALLNIAVVLGLVPTKGMVLPLVGYGGSATVMYLAAVGLLLRLSKQDDS